MSSSDVHEIVKGGFYIYYWEEGKKGRGDSEWEEKLASGPFVVGKFFSLVFPWTLLRRRSVHGSFLFCAAFWLVGGIDRDQVGRGVRGNVGCGRGVSGKSSYC